MDTGTINKGLYQQIEDNITKYRDLDVSTIKKVFNEIFYGKKISESQGEVFNNWFNQQLRFKIKGNDKFK